MKFFFDNNLSEHLARGLLEFGEDVMHLRDHFNEDEADVVWQEYIGKNGIILITKDERIRRNPLELNSINKHKVGVFFLGGKKQGRCKIIQQVVRNWPRIKELAIKTRPPFAYRVPPTGTKIEKIGL